MSVSTTPTRAPVLAQQYAKFAVRFDLPVPPLNEWIATTVPISRTQLRA